MPAACFTNTGLTTPGAGGGSPSPCIKKLPQQQNMMDCCEHRQEESFLNLAPTTNTLLNLRRSLSAVDMSQSSKQSSVMKKNASSDNLHEVAVVVDHEEGFSSPDAGKGAFDDIWKSINNIQLGSNNKNSLLPLYVHPLSKRSGSSLSDKSLEICTESLGSETGSDGFSLLTLSEEEDNCNNNNNKYDTSNILLPAEEEEEEDEKKNVVAAAANAADDQGQVVPPTTKYNRKVAAAAAAAAAASSVRPFPPPLSSLASRGNGSSLHVTMRSHREDGRLVLEAVSVPSPNCFRAQRQDGRLLLTFEDQQQLTSTPDADDDDDAAAATADKVEVTMESHHDDDEIWDKEAVLDQKNKLVSTMLLMDDQQPKLQNGNHRRGVGTTPPINIYSHKFKFMGLTSRSPQSKRPHHNKSVVTNDTTAPLKEDAAKPPLPPRPPTSPTSRPAFIPTPTSFNYNAYEYYWRTTTATATATATATPPPTPTPAHLETPGKRAPPPTLSPRINDMFVQLAQKHDVEKLMLLGGPTTTTDKVAAAAVSTVTKEFVSSDCSSSSSKGVFTKQQQPPPLPDHDQHRLHHHHHHHHLPPPFVAGCRLSLLTWEPRCIATS